MCSSDLQNLPQTTSGQAISKGFEVLHDAPGSADVGIVATGSEVSVALDAARLLDSSGITSRVVSLPSWERLRAQGLAEFTKVMSGCHRTVSLEAGSTMGWHEFVDHPLGIDRFGASAPGNVVMEKLGIAAQPVADAIRALIGR